VSDGRPQVAIDVRRATLWPQTGIARYSRNLLVNLQRLQLSDLTIRAIDVSGSSQWPGALAVGRGRPALRRAMEEQVQMAALTRKLDLLHLPWSEGPVRPACPFVLTLFDLATVEHASSYELGFRAYYNTLLRAHMRGAATVIVTSQATLQAARERWPRQRFRLIPLAVDSCFRASEGDSRTSEPTILYTGGFDPRKRVGDLFEAVARVGSSVKLVLTGSPPPGIVKLAERTLDRRVSFSGYVSDEQLASLYRRAWLVAYPTQMEGFGFPVVEAFASGTPVVATSVGSIAEVAGDAALLVSPGDVDALAEAIQRLLSDEQLRRSLRAAGLRRVASYSWDAVASRTLAVYRELLASSN
jgi:glycosyltransferase involved in cell wall biosynthesis